MTRNCDENILEIFINFIKHFDFRALWETFFLVTLKTFQSHSAFTFIFAAYRLLFVATLDVARKIYYNKKWETYDYIIIVYDLWSIKSV